MNLKIFNSCDQKISDSGLVGLADDQISSLRAHKYKNTVEYKKSVILSHPINVIYAEYILPDVNTGSVRRILKHEWVEKMDVVIDS